MLLKFRSLVVGEACDECCCQVATNYVFADFFSQLLFYLYFYQMIVDYEILGRNNSPDLLLKTFSLGMIVEEHVCFYPKFSQNLSSRGYFLLPKLHFCNTWLIQLRVLRSPPILPMLFTHRMYLYLDFAVLGRNSFYAVLFNFCKCSIPESL